MIKRIKYEKYKIFEFSQHAELILTKGEQHTHTFIFFAGFNEFASKYIYLFKSFFEKLEECNVKVIIPYLPSYSSKDEEVKYFNNSLNRFTTINTWIYIKTGEKGNRQVYTDKETHEYILNLISREINTLGSERIILGGFSQGGYYLFKYILEPLKIRTCFIVVFKSPLYYYDNPHKDDEKCISFNSNHIHLFFSRFDKVAEFNSCLTAYQKLKEFFPNVFIKYDNGKHHIVDYGCLEMLEELFLSYLKGKTLVKF